MPTNSEKEISFGLGLLAKSSIIVFMGLVFSKIFTYFYRIIIARFYGPEIYGVFSLSLMIAGWVVAFAGFGLTEGILRYVPIFRAKKQFHRIRLLLKYSYLTTILSGILGGVFLFFLSNWISESIFKDPSLIIFLQIFSILIPLWVFSNLFLALIRAFERINVYSFLLNIFQNILKVVFLGIFIYLGFSQTSIPLSYLFSTLVLLVSAYLYSVYFISSSLKKTSTISSEDKKTFRGVFAYSWPLMFYGIIGNLLHWVDSFTIGYFKDTFSVGVYNAAIPIALFLMLAPEMFMQLFFPLITRHNSKREFSVSRELSKQVGKWIFIVNLPIFLLIFIFPGSFLNLLFGSEYIVASTALKILVVGFFAFSLFQISINLLSSLGKSKTLLYNILGVCTFNLVLNIFLVPKFGLEGAAFSTSLSFILLGTLAVIQSYKISAIIPLRRKMLLVFLSSLFPLILILLLRKIIPLTNATIILLLSLFFLVYLLCLFLTKSFDKNDLEIFKKIYLKLK